MCRSSFTGLFTKDTGKVLIVATLLHALKESYSAVLSKSAIGSRIDNVIEKWALEMALEVVHLSNVQRLTVFDERQLLHLLYPDEFAEPAETTTLHDDTAPTVPGMGVVRPLPRKLVSSPPEVRPEQL